MRLASSFTLMVLLAGWPAAAGQAPPPYLKRPAPPAGLSWEEADSLTRKLLAIEKRRRERSSRPETILVTQGELNSFLNLSFAGQMPRGITGVSVRLDHQRIEATGLVDLDQVQGARPASSRWSLRSLLAGRVPVLLRGRLLDRDGFGTLEWEEVRLSSMPLPLSVLEQLVVSATRSARNPNGFDIHAPFRLPYSARRVRLEPGKAFLEF